jgi:ELWxxDGT repeat protein
VLVKSFGLNSNGRPRTPIELENVNGTLFFSLADTPFGTELWRSNGTTAGTLMLKKMSASPSLNLDTLTASGGKLFFATDDLVHGRELWTSNGTEWGTLLVKDILTGSASSKPSSLVNVNGVLFFAANDGVHGEEIWRSDGTEAGTQLLADVVAGSGGSNPAQLTKVGPLVYFSAVDDAVGRELFALPATPRPALIQIQGTAAGGIFTVSTTSGMSVLISTQGGQSAQTVAGNLASAINADLLAQAQGISAQVVGSTVILVRTDAANATSWTNDPGLGGEPPQVALNASGRPTQLAVALILALAAWLGLRATRPVSARDQA